MTTDEKGTAMRVPPSRDDDTPSERTPEPARVHRQMPNSPAPTACPCASCVAEAGVSAWWMIVCDECGNKRCPHGTDHRHECTGSNEPGQVGSGYARMTSDAHIETITDRATIRDSDEPSERGDFPYCDTPAPVGAAVAPNLDAARAMLNAANTIKATGGAVEIGGVRIEPCDEYGSTVTTARAESAEAEVGTLRDTLARRTDSHTQLVRENEALRAKVAEVEAKRDEFADLLARALPAVAALARVEALDDGNPDHADTCGSMLTPGAGYPCSCWQADLRAALATTGEVQ